MRIEILGTGCAKCKRLEANAKEAVPNLGVDAEIVKVTDVGEILGFGVMTTPALAIDGQVKVAGRVVDAKTIAGWISASAPGADS